ncbi:hypothetical protein [Lentzea guizhouensis]|nr:hypothetical protein [Lentzea guizhouensis]
MSSDGAEGSHVGGLARISPSPLKLPSTIHTNGATTATNARLSGT